MAKKALAITVVLILSLSLSVHSAAGIAQRAFCWLNTQNVVCSFDVHDGRCELGITVIGKPGTVFKNGTIAIKRTDGARPGTVCVLAGIGSDTNILSFKDTSCLGAPHGVYEAIFTVDAVRDGNVETITKQIKTSVRCGDINTDHKINAKDISLLLKILVNKVQPSPAQRILVDTNCDGRVNVKDVVFLLRLVSQE